MPITRYARRRRGTRSAAMYRSRAQRARYAAAMRRRRRPAPRRSLPLSGFPSRKIVRLRYAENINLNATGTGTPVHHTFSANGMYDPNISGVGHQPMGFDQWLAIYDHYTVLGSKCTVRYIPTTATDFAPMAFGCMLTDDTTFPYTDLDAILESRAGGRNYRLGATLNSATSKGLSVTRFFSAKKALGRPTVVGEEELKGSSITNPTEQSHFQVWCVNPTSAGNDPPVCSFMVIIEYIAMLTERRELAQS